MRHRTRRSPRFTLTSMQHATIDQMAQSLPPDVRHSFILRVSRTLRLSAPSAGFVSDSLVSVAIDHALAELAA